MLEQASPELQKILFQKFPQFRLITRNDQTRLREFLRDTPMETPLLSLSYERGENYVASLEEQGENVMGWVLENDRGEVEGLAHLYIKRMYFRGKSVRCGYLGDLRLKATASYEQRTRFRELYREFLIHLQQIPEVCGCEFVLAAIMSGNRKAVLAMTKPNKYFRYHLVGSYDTQTIFGRLPNFRLESSRFRLVRGPFSREFDFEKYDLQEDIRESSDQNYRLLNERGEVVAQFQLWEPRKKLYFHRLSKRIQLMGQLPKLFGRAPLAEKESLSALYLSGICFAKGLSCELRQEALSRVLHVAYEKFRQSQNQVLMVNGPRQWNLNEALKKNRFLFLPGQGHLFQVTTNDSRDLLQLDDFYFDISRS